MRYGLVLTTVFIAAGIGLGAPSHVSAELTPELGALVALSGDVETSKRRYDHQLYGYDPGRYVVPPVVVPAPVVVPPAVVEARSFRHLCPRVRRVAGNTAIWNGEYCVDARYNRAYVGPRP